MTVLRHMIRRPAMLAALAAAVALAALAAAPGGAAAKPRTPALGLGPRVLPAIDLGSESKRRARPPVGVSNASLLFERGVFRPLPDVPSAAVTTHLRDNNRGRSWAFTPTSRTERRGCVAS